MSGAERDVGAERQRVRSGWARLPGLINQRGGDASNVGLLSFLAGQLLLQLRHEFLLTVVPGAYSFTTMTRAFKIYAVLVALAAGLVLVAANWEVAPADLDRHWNAVAAFLVLGFVSEASYLKLRVGRAETQSSVSFIPFIGSVLLFDTGWAAAIAAASMLGVEALVRHKVALRVIFNTSQISLSVAAASTAYHLLHGTSSLTLFHLKPWGVAAAVVVYFLTNTVAVGIAVALGHKENIRTVWVRIAGASLLYDMVTSVLAPLLAYLYVGWEAIGILILIIPIYLVRHLYQVSLQLEQVNRDLLELMVKAIEARDPYTSGHSLRVSQMAAVIARDLGLGHRQIEQVRTAALLHDVGKIHEEYAPLLRKEGKLDPTEKALMQTHSARSAELVSTISGFKGVITDAVLHHHENYDGSGYPTGLAGKAIPVGSRIIMICDTVDAMTTDRPYRKALSFERVVQELKRFSGQQFDPELVDVCLKSPSIRDLVEKRVNSQYLPSVASLEEVAPPQSLRRQPLVRRVRSPS